MEQQGYIYNHNNNNKVYFNGETVMPPEFYSVGLYTRFSKDDGQTSDNSSIET